MTNITTQVRPKAGSRGSPGPRSRICLREVHLSYGSVPSPGGEALRRRRIKDAADAAWVVRHLLDSDRERIIVLHLDASHRLVAWEEVSVGTIDASLAIPRDVLKGAVIANAAAVLMVHNHPSGQCEPSDADRRFHEQMKLACALLGVELLDSLVVAEEGIYSLMTRQETEWPADVAHVAPRVRDREALDAITAFLDGKAWTADTLDSVAEVVRSTGRAVRDASEAA